MLWSDYEKERVIQASLREFVIHFVFLILLSIVSLNTTSTDTYAYSSVVQGLFRSHASIKRIDQLWNFLETDFLEGIYWETWYNEGHEGSCDKDGIKINCVIDPKDRMVLDSSRLLGSPRLRQLKVLNDSCMVNHKFRKWINVCYGHYSRQMEDTNKFSPVISRIYSNDTAWRYQTEKELREPSFWGQLNTYSGGGFVQPLSKNHEASYQIIKELKEGMWITRGTRFISLDFSLYNANENLFCFVRLSYEFPPSGGVVPMFSIRTVKLLRYLENSDYSHLGSEIVLTLFVLYYIVEECLEINSIRLKYFQGFWNLLDIVIVVSSSVFVILNLYLAYITLYIVKSRLSNEDYSPEFMYLANLFGYLQYAASFGMFIAWIKVFKYTSFNKTMLHLIGTLRQSAPDLLGFLFMFQIVFVAFANVAYITFGSTIPSFSSVVQTFFSQIRIILGDFNFASIEKTDSVVGPAWFIIYIFFVFFVLMNMFLAIINDKYSLVKSEVESQDVTFQVSDYLLRGYNNMREAVSIRDKLIDIQTTIKIEADEGRVTYEKIRSAMRGLNFTDIEIDIICLSYQKEDGTYDFLNKEQEVFVSESNASLETDQGTSPGIADYMEILKKVNNVEEKLALSIAKVESHIQQCV